MVKHVLVMISTSVEKVIVDKDARLGGVVKQHTLGMRVLLPPTF